MAPLSKLTLTSYRRTQPHRDPVEERRSKTLAALEQQKLVLAAVLNGQEHTVTKPGWARDVGGNRHRVEKTHAVRPWFFQDAQGWVVQLKYGARVVLSYPPRTVPVYFGKGNKETWLESVILMKMC